MRLVEQNKYNGKQSLLVHIGLCVGYEWWWLGGLFDSCPVANSSQLCYTRLWAYPIHPFLLYVGSTGKGYSTFLVGSSIKKCLRESTTLVEPTLEGTVMYDVIILGAQYYLLLLLLLLVGYNGSIKLPIPKSHSSPWPHFRLASLVVSYKWVKINVYDYYKGMLWIYYYYVGLLASDCYSSYTHC